MVERTGVGSYGLFVPSPLLVVTASEVGEDNDLEVERPSHKLTGCDLLGLPLCLGGGLFSVAWSRGRLADQGVGQRPVDGMEKRPFGADEGAKPPRLASVSVPSTSSIAGGSAP